jgi:hypothetical protein
VSTRTLRSKILIVTLGCLVNPSWSIAAPQTKKCKGSERLVGDCFTVHGRMTLGNGGPAIRIWRIGTERMLGVWEPNEGDKDVSWLPNPIDGQLDYDRQIFADFEVCPLTKETPDELQIVCVQSATHVVTRDLRKKEEGNP